MSIFSQQLGASQTESVESKDQKGNGSTREVYFNVPKNAKGVEYEMLKLSEGLNLIEILPFYFQGGVLHGKEAGAFDYRLDVQVNKSIGASGSDVLSLASLGQADPLSEELTNMYTMQKTLTSQADKDKFYEDKIKPLRAKRRCIYIVLHTVEGKRIPKIFETAHFSFEKLIADKLEEEKALGLPPRIFADPLTGCSIAIMGKKDSFSGHEFIKVSSIAFVDRKTPIVKDEDSAVKLVKSLPKLDSLLVVKTYDEVRDLYFGAQPKTASVEETTPEEEPLTFDVAPLDDAPVNVEINEVEVVEPEPKDDLVF